jgi:hypothetical protein
MKSPWYHTPLYVDKYADRYRSREGVSFQKYIGIHGNGFVHTKSADCPYTGLPKEKKNNFLLILSW